MGGKFHLKLNIGERPIANKYREGKMKRTLKRELKVLEIVKREALEFSILLGFILLFAREEPVDECASLWFNRLDDGWVVSVGPSESASFRFTWESGGKGRVVAIPSVIVLSS